MNARTKLLAAVAVAGVVGMVPASAHEPHPTQYLSCDLVGSSTGGSWTGSVHMKVTDTTAVTVDQSCWLQTGSTFSYTTGPSGEVAGSRTTCAAAGSAAGTNTSCNANIAFDEPAATLYYCVEVKWTTADAANHRYGKCTRRVRFSYAAPEQVNDVLNTAEAILAPYGVPVSAPRRIGITAGLTRTSFGTTTGTGGSGPGGPVNVTVGPISLQA